MKTIEEIKKLTKNAIKEQDEAYKLAVKKEESEKKRKEKETIKRAEENVKTFYPEQIEEAAKKGQTFYNIDIGDCDDEFVQLEVKFIKKHLSDFNPTFTNVNREAGICNYDGDIIDTRYYTATRVTFSW